MKPLAGSANEKARRVPCSACGAPIGQNCVSRFGKETMQHFGRIEAAAKAYPLPSSIVDDLAGKRSVHGR